MICLRATYKFRGNKTRGRYSPAPKRRWIGTQLKLREKQKGGGKEKKKIKKTPKETKKLKEGVEGRGDFKPEAVSQRRGEKRKVVSQMLLFRNGGKLKRLEVVFKVKSNFVPEASSSR